MERLGGGNLLTCILQYRKKKKKKRNTKTPFIFFCSFCSGKRWKTRRSMTAWKEGVNLYRVTRIIYFSRKRTLPFARREKGSRLAEFIALIQIYRVKVRVNGDRSEVIRRKSNPLRPSDAKVVFWNNALQVMSFYSNPDNATAGKIRSASASLPFLHAPLSLSLSSPSFLSTLSRIYTLSTRRHSIWIL